MVSNKPLDAKALLIGLMNVVDNLERAVMEDADEDSAMTEGVRAIHKQLSDLLYKQGVRSFDAVGQRFDANFHEAVGTVYSGLVPPNQVMSVLANGYYLNEKLFRPARVVVSTRDKAAKSSGWEKAKQDKKKVAERSSVNRPSWLTKVPPNTRDFYFFVGKSTENTDLEKGKSVARDLALGEILRSISLDTSLFYSVAYRPMVEALNVKILEGGWARLIDLHPKLKRCHEDCFWERVSSEISGDVYNVAILMAISKDVFDALMLEHGEVERWAGMEMVNPGPFLTALLGKEPGGLVFDVRKATMAERAGLEAGDVIHYINNLPSKSAAGTRRLLGRMSLSKAKFSVLFKRKFIEAAPSTIHKRKPGSE